MYKKTVYKTVYENANFFSLFEELHAQIDVIHRTETIVEARQLVRFDRQAHDSILSGRVRNVEPGREK